MGTVVNTKVVTPKIMVDDSQAFNTYQLAFPANMAVNDKLNLIAVTLVMDILFIQDECPCKVNNRSNHKCCGMCVHACSAFRILLVVVKWLEPCSCSIVRRVVFSLVGAVPVRNGCFWIGRALAVC